MKHLNRILSFSTVAFLLVFFGRINKVDLYTAFFRTIQDVEIRNSTGVEEGQARLSDLLNSSQKTIETPPSTPSFGFLSEIFVFTPGFFDNSLSLILSREGSIKSLLYLLSHPHSIP